MFLPFTTVVLLLRKTGFKRQDAISTSTPNPETQDLEKADEQADNNKIGSSTSQKEISPTAAAISS